MINDTHPAEHNHSHKLLAFTTVFDYGTFSHHHCSEEEQYCSCGCLVPVERTMANEFNGNMVFYYPSKMDTHTDFGVLQQ